MCQDDALYSDFSTNHERIQNKPRGCKTATPPPKKRSPATPASAYRANIDPPKINVEQDSFAVLPCLAARSLMARFRISLPVAMLLVELAGLGGANG